jgi:hypothetical protein
MGGAIPLLLPVPCWGAQGSCRLHVTMTVTAKTTVLWYVTPCSFLDGYRCSEEHIGYQNTRRHITESSNVKWYTLWFLVLIVLKMCTHFRAKLISVKYDSLKEGGETRHVACTEVSERIRT